MKCSDCGYENRAGVLVCENCGSDIYDLLVGEAATKEISEGATRELRLSEPSSSRPVMLYIADSNQPVSVERKNNLILGRIDPGKPEADEVDVDLTAFDAQQQGVSRQHASLNARQDPPTLTDLGSYNGTFVNGKRLEDDPQILSSGDEVQLGQLKMRVYFK